MTNKCQGDCPGIFLQIANNKFCYLLHSVLKLSHSLNTAEKEKRPMPTQQEVQKAVKIFYDTVSREFIAYHLILPSGKELWARNISFKDGWAFEIIVESLGNAVVGYTFPQHMAPAVSNPIPVNPEQKTPLGFPFKKIAWSPSKDRDLTQAVIIDPAMSVKEAIVALDRILSDIIASRS